MSPPFGLLVVQRLLGGFAQPLLPRQQRLEVGHCLGALHTTQARVVAPRYGMNKHAGLPDRMTRRTRTEPAQSPSTDE